jgi:hypothetical protein
MSNAHTPGPWEAWQRQSAVFVVACDFQVALLCDGNNSEINANAHLIAAAPDMLAALRGILDDAKAYGMADSAFSGSLIEAAAAIAKAEGRT